MLTGTTSVSAESFDQDLIGIGDAASIGRYTESKEAEATFITGLGMHRRQSVCQFGDEGIETHAATLRFSPQSEDQIVRQIERHSHLDKVAPAALVSRAVGSRVVGSWKLSSQR